MNNDYELETHAVRTGQNRTLENEHSEAMFLTSSYVFNSAAQAAARFSGDEPGNIYSRFSNPTVANFEQRLAAMEGGQRCIATASGMAAIFSMVIGLLKTGEHVVASQSIFGTTVVMFDQILRKLGIETTFVPLTDHAAWQDAIQDNTRLLFLETPSNPVTELVDIRALATLAHDHQCLLAVDNCLATPVLQRPFELGADLVIHSATKYLDGQGRCIGGAVIGDETLLNDIFAILRSSGPSMSPFNAWVFLKGLETLSIRMKAHCENALALASWLEQQPQVERVYYPGLPSHPQYELAQQQQLGSGGMLAFDVKGGKDSAWQVIDHCHIFSITANLGDTKSTITHPATTTHGRVPLEQRLQAGIGDGLVRISVGLEAINDLKADLQRGFESL
ncbi:O-succinylhomoserine sulfhydrylase [Candidatus Venteria ishoeyi]|uniref:O-succinylhomoserine sulfhydrylase n=1 Tax=Candidatus Venteria ishoeyi TaxID=1899563 RepID=A0A1H6FIN1_9GAMM|nr:O-succinylhomoserine sulfhydrylase [Candidatus Venteria ishoeyi]SEH08976.1 O-succinylhomoserine sulfhydrylase [Candidatus Venteria ishoeyi]